jgi:hypothetical protein
VIVIGIPLPQQFRTEFQNQKPANPKTVRTPHNFSPVGAAAGCDLLILSLKTTSKDRSLRQLLQGIVAIR